jgi:hypothetical protein
MFQQASQPVAVNARACCVRKPFLRHHNLTWSQDQEVENAIDNIELAIFTPAHATEWDILAPQASVSSLTEVRSTALMTQVQTSVLLFVPAGRVVL